MTNELLKQCPICSSPDLSPGKSVKDYFGDREVFHLSSCKQCETLITNPRPSEEKIVTYYKSDSYVSHGDKKGFIFDKVYHTVQSLNFKRKLQILQTYTLEKNHLDYGCGTGSFLKFLKSKEWHTTGIEPDAKARAIAKEHNSIGETYSSLSDMIENSNGQLYSSISLYHVLEHVHTLKETLEGLISLLNRNGILILALPNYKCFDAEVYGEHWAGYDVPRHLYHFSQKSVHQLARSFGLNIVATHPMKFDSYYVSLLSEQYKNGGKRYFNAFINGYKSNRKASKSHEYSSLIYVLSR